MERCVFGWVCKEVGRIWKELVAGKEYNQMIFYEKSFKLKTKK